MHPSTLAELNKINGFVKISAHSTNSPYTISIEHLKTKKKSD